MHALAYTIHIRTATHHVSLHMQEHTMCTQTNHIFHSPVAVLVDGHHVVSEGEGMDRIVDMEWGGDTVQNCLQSE